MTGVILERHINSSEGFESAKFQQSKPLGTMATSDRRRRRPSHLAASSCCSGCRSCPSPSLSSCPSLSSISRNRRDRRRRRQQRHIPALLLAASLLFVGLPSANKRSSLCFVLPVVEGRVGENTSGDSFLDYDVEHEVETLLTQLEEDVVDISGSGSSPGNTNPGLERRKITSDTEAEDDVVDSSSSPGNTQPELERRRITAEKVDSEAEEDVVDILYSRNRFGPRKTQQQQQQQQQEEEVESETKVAVPADLEQDERIDLALFEDHSEEPVVEVVEVLEADAATADGADGTDTNTSTATNSTTQGADPDLMAARFAEAEIISSTPVIYPSTLQEVENEMAQSSEEAEEAQAQKELQNLGRAADETGSGRPFLSLFPETTAPTDTTHRSEVYLNRQFMNDRMHHWHPDLNEQDVFHARLEHRSVTERSWELGIGKGGHMYSLYCNAWGEMMAPSTPQSQWNDEVWQMTSIYGSLMPNDLPDIPGLDVKGANGFVHQSGIYTKQSGVKPFYSPILEEWHDEATNSYGVLSWAQVPSPSINRSGVLTYARYRDLGGGVLEVSYVLYNFENTPVSNVSPWGGVRTSSFPDHVLSNNGSNSRPLGSYRFFSPFHYGYEKLEGSRINMEDTGGWAAVTKNADDPNSLSIGVVFGRDLDKVGDHTGKPRYDVGDSRHGTRDYTVQATVVNVRDRPGTAHSLRMFFVMGSLQKVAAKSNSLVQHAKYEPLNITETNSPRVALYAKTIGQDTVLSRQRGDVTDESIPVCEIYAQPVFGSMPVFVIKNEKTGRYFVTSDPYAQCPREPFPNPLDPSDASYEKYQNRNIYHPYRRETDWVELLGFAMPAAKAEVANLALSEVVPDGSFDAGEKAAASDLMVLPSST